MSNKNQKFSTVEGGEQDESLQSAEEQAIAKPTEKFSLDQYKSKRAATVAGVVTLQTALPVHSLAQAKDFVRLHPSFWTDELCFVSVPIKGAPRDSMHLIPEDLAMQYLPSKRIIRHRLALASKPLDRFFLCTVPSANLDNSWVASNLVACEQAKTLWTQATSRKDEGIDAYNITVAVDPDAFPDPQWPLQSLEELVVISFTGRTIDREDHPGLLRLIGAKPTTA